MSGDKEDNELSFEELSQLRQEVKLTSSKLLDLTYNESQYSDTLEQYNLKAKQLINQDYIEEALIYLAEAERLLEYGASCGKTIDRNIIIATLHNEACCYYKANDLTTAARYLEAVIFNLKTHLGSVESSPNNSSNSDHQRGLKHDELLFVAVQKKIELVHYYLKYCTVNSQAKNRPAALEAGKQTIRMLREFFSDLKEHRALLSDQSMQGDDLHTLVLSLNLFKEEILPSQLDNYLALARCLVKRWNEQKTVKKMGYHLEKHISNYSISQIIEMSPVDYQLDGGDKLMNSKVVMRQMLHVAMGYFTISTEYRLMAEQFYLITEERSQCEEYIKANIYHLLAILFLARHLHCDLLFMKQIISSYEYHFKVSILQQETNLDSPEQLVEELLLDRPVEKKVVNSSLVAKLHRLKSKSRDKDKRKVHTEYEDTELYESKATYKVNETKVKGRRSVSKHHLKCKGVKNDRILNDSLFESSKHLNTSKDHRHINASKDYKQDHKPRTISTANKPRSISNSKKMVPLKLAKPRNSAKETEPVKSLKFPVKPVDKPAEKAPTKSKQVITKRYNDEYQLSKAKCPVKKRVHSISSADLSCTDRDQNRTKGSAAKKSQRGKPEEVSGRKKLRGCKQSKEVLPKNYYV